MKNIIYYLLLYLLIFSNLTVVGQVADTLKVKKFDGVNLSFDFIYSNLTGDIQSSTSNLSFSNNNALRNISSGYGFGISLFSERSFRKNENFSYRPSIGVRQISGFIDFETNGTGIPWVNDSILEIRHTFSFNNLFIHTAHYLQYKPLKKAKWGFIAGVKAALRVRNEVEGNTVVDIVDYNEVPVFRTLLREKDYSKYNNHLISAQINFDVGLNKSFKIGSSTEVKVELRYEIPIIDFFQRVNLNSRPITLSLAYKLFEKRKRKF